ncbi:major capsid protein [Brucella sp. TWI432]
MAELTLDVFNDDAFSVTSLSDTIDNLIYRPGRIGQLGLFEDESINTTTAAFELRGDIITLVAPTPRGGPGVTVAKDKRSMRAFIVPHFQIDDAVYAEEVQGIRAYGTTSALEQLSGKIARRLQQHNNSMGVTEEFSRLGAVKGVITYADGSTLNLFDEFGVTQEGTIGFDLSTSVKGALRKKCMAVTRTMAGVLGGIPFGGILAVCGDDFFDALIANEEVRETYLNQQAANQLRDAYGDGGSNGIYGSFKFGGITFENYRGAIIDGKTFIGTNDCHMVPLGVSGLFKSLRAPADYIQTVNTMGMRMYAKQYRMPNDKGINLEVQTNSLHLCKRPKALLKGAK